MNLRATPPVRFLIFCALVIFPAPLSARQVTARNDTPTVRIDGNTVAVGPSQGSVTLVGRGVRSIRLRIFRVAPVELVRALRHPYGAGAEDPLGLHPRNDVGEMQADLWKFVSGRPALREILVPTLSDSVGAFTQNVPLPVKNVGAYVLTAEGGDGIARSVGLYFRTDLHVTRRAASGKRGGFTYTVTDVRTGRAQSGVRILTRDAYATRWGFQLDSNRGELPQPQPLDSLPASEFRYQDASGVTDSRGHWRIPRADFVGQGKRVSLEAGTPMATGGLQYDYSQTIAVNGTHFGIVAGDFWGAYPKKR